jgi:hypothetical protein
MRGGGLGWRDACLPLLPYLLYIEFMSGRDSGFQVFCSNRISPEEETPMENLARYFPRASFSQERMQYLQEPSKVVYRAKDGTAEKAFDALEWLAAMPCYY